MTFSLFIDINHVNRAKKYGTKLLHVYVLYYFILKDFSIACHYKTYIMPTLFLLLMSSYAILTCTIMLTVCVTNIECLLIGIACYEFSII